MSTQVTFSKESLQFLNRSTATSTFNTGAPKARITEKQNKTKHFCQLLCKFHIRQNEEGWHVDDLDPQ